MPGNVRGMWPEEVAGKRLGVGSIRQHEDILRAVETFD